MLIEKLKNSTWLTPSELTIANYLLKYPEQLVHLSSEELGRKSFTSQATVTRLAQKLGCKNYRTFILELTRELEELKRANDYLTGDEPLSEMMAIEDVMETLPNLYQKTTINTKLLQNKVDLSKVCQKIIQCDIVDVYGMGITETLARQLAFKLNSTGVLCQSHNGYNRNYIKVGTKERSVVAILFTLTGNNQSIWQTIKQLKAANVFTIVIGGGKVAEHVEECDIILPLDSNHYFQIDTLSSLFSAQYIIDILFAMLLVKKQQQVIGITK